MADQAGNLALLERFIAAWGRRDADAVVACLAPNATYAASVGPEPGATYVGRTAIRAGVAKMFAHDADSEMSTDRPAMMGDIAVLTWTYRSRTPTGTVRAVRGCDIFVFEAGEIVLKDAFRKTEA